MQSVNGLIFGIRFFQTCWRQTVYQNRQRMASTQEITALIPKGILSVRQTGSCQATKKISSSFPNKFQRKKQSSCK